MTASSPYYGDSAVMRTPPPDLPSLLLKERIVYLGLPLFSDDDAKRQLGMDVTELIIAQLLFLEFDNSEKPIYFYINSTGTSGWTGSSQMRKSISIGSGTTADATFSVGIDTTASVGYGFTISLGSTDTRNLSQGRYMYDVLVSSGATIYRIVDGMIYVRPGISSAL